MLVEACTTLNQNNVQYVIAGGWVPVLRGNGERLIHPGTRDVDVLKAFALGLAVILASTCQGQTKTSAPVAQPCVIVKRHVHKFGENMSRFHPHRPFDYVEGDYPPGFKWRSELSDSDVRELQRKGGRVIVMRSDYQLSDLEDAKKQCQSQTLKQ